MEQTATTWLTPAEAVAYLRDRHGVRRTIATLAKIRCIDRSGPQFVRIGRRAIFYSIDALDEYAGRIVSAPMRSTKSQ
jgi:hypothetical protein